MFPRTFHFIDPELKMSNGLRGEEPSVGWAYQLLWRRWFVPKLFFICCDWCGLPAGRLLCPSLWSLTQRVAHHAALGRPHYCMFFTPQKRKKKSSRLTTVHTFRAQEATPQKPWERLPLWPLLFSISSIILFSSYASFWDRLTHLLDRLLKWNSEQALSSIHSIWLNCCNHVFPLEVPYKEQRGAFLKTHRGCQSRQPNPLGPRGGAQCRPVADRGQ